VAPRAAAQDLTGCAAMSSRQWTIDRLGKDHVKLVGQVEVTCDDATFYADEVEVFSDRHRVEARGSVVFSNATARIAADRAEFDTQAKTGVFHDASGTASVARPRPPAGQAAASPRFGTEPDVHFYGRTIELLGRDRYRITRGAFTTCVQPTPRWELTTGSATVHVGEYAFLTHALLKVKGVPVLYVPAIYYPVQDDGRATGFLVPSYGTSTLRGQSIANAFFWAIDRSQDATFLHDYHSRTGQGVGGEYRYATGPGSTGTLRVYHLRERQVTDEATGSVSAPARRSVQVQGTLAQRLGSSWRLRGRADYFSSLELLQAYSQDVSQASNRTRVLSGSLAGTVAGLAVSASADRREYFYDATSTSTYGGSPRLVVTRNEQPVFGSRYLYFSATGEYDRLTLVRRSGSTVADRGLSRYDLLPRLRIPFTRWQWLTVTSTVGYRATYWTEQLQDDAQVERGLGRGYYELATEVTGPVWSRIWARPGSTYASKVKHSVQPYFSVQRTSSVDAFDRIVQVDSVDTIVGDTTRVGYGIVNRVYRKAGGGGSSREIASVTLGQTYYSNASASAYDAAYVTSTATPSRFSPLSLAVRVSPLDGTSGSVRAEYDTRYSAFRTLAADGTVTWGGWLQATGGWSQQRYIAALSGYDDRSSLAHSLNAQLQVSPPSLRLGGSYSINYDFLHDSVLQQRIVASYNAQCCGVTVEYQAWDLTRLGLSGIGKDHRVSISFTLGGIGAASNLSGTR
jgi:LPS-assembly protein